jgi:hypothetical protein
VPLLPFIAVNLPFWRSLAWIYQQPRLLAEIDRLRQPRPGTKPVPASQKATTESLRQQLHAYREEITRLRAEITSLREQLAPPARRRTHRSNHQPDSKHRGHVHDAKTLKIVPEPGSPLQRSITSRSEKARFHGGPQQIRRFCAHRLLSDALIAARCAFSGRTEDTCQRALSCYVPHRTLPARCGRGRPGPRGRSGRWLGAYREPGASPLPGTAV